MNNKIIIILILIFSGITTTYLVMNQLEHQNQIKIIEEEQSESDVKEIEKTDNEILNEISEKYNEIEFNKEEFGEKSVEFEIRDREWQKSGPFSIDRKEYALGEKIFLKAEQILPSESGQIVFLRNINQTHYKVWTTYNFDGQQKNAFNVYFEPVISKSKSICEKSDLIGEWIVTFRNTNYQNLEFEIIDMMVPGDERKFSNIVC